MNQPSAVMLKQPPATNGGRLVAGTILGQSDRDIE
jgi:hypothetical protein